MIARMMYLLSVKAAISAANFCGNCTSVRYTPTSMEAATNSITTDV